MGDIKYDIIEQIGVVAPSARGWNLELNLVSWNDKPAKFDIRTWSEEHDKMGKGITLTKDELIALKKLLNEVEIK